MPLFPERLIIPADHHGAYPFHSEAHPKKGVYKKKKKEEEKVITRGLGDTNNNLLSSGQWPLKHG